MMEASTENTYEPLSAGGRSNSRQFDATSDSPENNISPPKDTRHIVYLSLLTAGIGFILPYNSFIIASDYWQERFPGRSVTLDMSSTYIIVAFLSVLLNNVFLSIAPFRVRILFGYIISFTTLIFVAFCEVAWHVFSATTAYSVNLAAISFVAIGCTVQQSSFYGFTSMLPKKYTQSVMAGESIAGFLVSSNRVVTKLLIDSDKVSTVIFFLTSTIYIAFSYVLHSITIDSPFVRYHMKSCAKIVLRPDDNMEHLDDPPMSLYGVGVLTLESPNASAQLPPVPALSFSNPVYDLSNPSADSDSTSGLMTNSTSGVATTTTMTSSSKPNSNSITTTVATSINNNTDTVSTPVSNPQIAYKVEHVLTPIGSTRLGSFRRLKSGLEERWRVAQTIYPYMACIALAYLVTLSLYPGLESEIISCNLGTWMPVLLMFTFNTADVIGKILAAVPYSWSRRQLVLMSSLRALLIPLLLLCCAPRSQPTIAGEAPAFIFTAALGITNGLSGSLPIMLAPSKVPATLKEITGNMMTLSYMTGLTCGSLVGYVFDSMLGPQIPYPCLQYPYIPSKPINTTIPTTTTLAPTTLSTLLPSTTEQLLTTLATFATTTSTTIPFSTVATTFNSSFPFTSSENFTYFASTNYLEQSSTQIINATLFDE